MQRDKQESLHPGPDQGEEYLDIQVGQFREQYALSISKALLWLGASASVSEAILWFVLPGFPQLIILAVLTLPPTVSAALFPLLRRRGHGTAGRYLLLSSLMLDIFIGILMPQFLVAIAVLAVLIIVLCFLLLGGRDSLVLVGVCILCLAVTTAVGSTGTPSWLPASGEVVGWVFVAAITVFTTVVAAVTARLIVVGQDEQFRRAQQANLEIQKRVTIEQEQRERLQQANLEIEQRMATEKAQHEQLQRLLLRVRETADSLNQAADEILATSTQQATGSDEQSVAISQISATIDEVRTIAQQNSERAQAVADLARHTTEVSHDGQQAVTDTIQGMQEVKEKAESIAADILYLSEQAQAIGQIITAVNEIARQSNMLALNAAIEAARAGEAGRGFSVVAQEVRSLAEQSRASTEQVKEILTQIQRGINTAVMSAEDGMKRADVGVRLAGTAGLSIRQLTESVADSSQSAVQTAAAAGQQLGGMEQIVQAMQNIHLVTLQSAAGARQVERAAENLNHLAGELRTLLVQD